MGRFVKGEVVVFPFPFSDLQGSKPRPALVVANLPGDDMVLCMIRAIRLIPIQFLEEAETSAMA